MPRLEDLQKLLVADPNDAFLRYGVAMELAKQQRFGESIAEFEELLRRDQNYVPAYFMGGRTHEQAGDTDQARAWYTRGIAVAKKVGDMHAAGEIAQALDLLP